MLFALQKGVIKFAFETQVYRVLLSRATKLPSETRVKKYISTNPPKRLCKADTEGGSIGGEAALIRKTCQYLSFGGGF